MGWSVKVSHPVCGAVAEDGGEEVEKDACVVALTGTTLSVDLTPLKQLSGVVRVSASLRAPVWWKLQRQSYNVSEDEREMKSAVEALCVVFEKKVSASVRTLTGHRVDTDVTVLCLIFEAKVGGGGRFTEGH
jgi:hypothetical protein